MSTPEDLPERGLRRCRLDSSMKVDRREAALSAQPGTRPHRIKPTFAPPEPSLAITQAACLGAML
jgi:hypothetical protein